MGQVKALMEVNLGLRQTIGEVTESDCVKTVSDLLAAPPQSSDVEMCDESGGAWSVCTSDFSEVPFGECPSSSSDSFSGMLLSQGLFSIQSFQQRFFKNKTLKHSSGRP